MTLTITFDVPADLWLSSNRLPRVTGHLHRIVLDLHWLTKATARSQDLLPIPTPVHAHWLVQYAAGTGRADAANAQPTTKRLLDGLVKAGYLADDDDLHVATETFERGPNLPAVPRQGRNQAKPVRRIVLTLTPVKELP